MHKFEKLSKLIKNSYAPFSNFSVSAIAVDEKGNEYFGVNVENSTLGATICAERSAIVSAISNGVSFGKIKEVHILAVDKNNLDNIFFIKPCGICRQVILEASDKKGKVFVYNAKAEYKVYKITELLPEGFVFKK